MTSGGISCYPHHFGTQCEADLALAGFPRCTFDWGASYDTPWNSATSSIILANWVKAFDANAAKGFGILTSENTAENREQILRRWVGNKKQKYKDQEKLVDLMKTPEGVKQVQEQEAIVEGIARKRRMLIKVSWVFDLPFDVQLMALLILRIVQKDCGRPQGCCG
ncbi:uncharacterized protein MELLADRAFT_60769 [Melampsora larici-populina 98AG31]|uniref:Uncharacterized protein n=1 Tax=Melampsora larici-populina (strain 98AG31 / pathotype 3-4-7) TaxID=747676 RepID=F4RC70_MELLP|nr:uncharacterized protein MELLADRAFT_60769 [Melampsora larici-populina 98AG31]EGG09686.1 hypothetical protein MELLADRAFT_60769 [Melampsora larici-populina 98AG31]